MAAKKKNTSRQPRMAIVSEPTNKNVNPAAFLSNIIDWLTLADIEEPQYKADSRKRDRWLSAFWRRESHLAGVVSSMVAIDKNRGWTLTGGRNQVGLYTRILLHEAENGAGWRHYAAQQSLSYYTSDLGAITEIGRDGEDGPLRAIYHVDPTRCRLMPTVDLPLRYYPLSGKFADWKSSYYWNISSIPAVEEGMNGLGYCAVSRCLEFAKLMVGVFQHDQEMVGAAMPRGILLLHNISEEQWLTALQSRKAAQDSLDRRWFGSVMTLASSGIEQADVKLEALSNLPENFDKEKFTALTLYGYALAFGMDPSEFWPVNFGAMGRGTETELQHRKATGKGGLNFGLDQQERLQNELPDQLLYEIDQRDVTGEQLDAQLAQTHSQTVISLYEAGLAENQPLLGASVEQARIRALTMLADRGVIDQAWVEQEIDVQASDRDPTSNELARLRERIMDNPQVRRAAEDFPTEPIVQFNSRTRTLKTLWDSGEEVYARRSFPAAKPNEDPLEVLRALVQAPTMKERQASIRSIVSAFERSAQDAALGYVTGRRTLRQAGSILTAAVKEAWPRAAALGYEESGNDPDNMSDAEKRLARAQLADQLAITEQFLQDLRDIKNEEGDPIPAVRTQARGLQAVYNEWVLRGLGGKIVIWFIGSTHEHCRDCRGFAGKRIRASTLVAKNMIPGLPGSALACGGWKCRCHVKSTTGEMVTLKLLKAM